MSFPCNNTKPITHLFPSLYYLFSDLLGINIPFLDIFKMFGTMLTLSFVAGGYVISLELKRKETEGIIKPIFEKRWKGKPASISELAETFIVTFILGFKLVLILFNYDEFLRDVVGYIISFKGNFIGGLLAGVLFTYRRYRLREKLKLSPPVLETVQMRPVELTGNITIIAGLSGIIGAKIFDALEDPEAFFQNPAMLISASGLTVYGGLILGAISVLIYTGKKGLSPLHVVDMAAPAMMLAYSVGRIGCQLSGDGDWGIDNLTPKPGWLSFLPNWMWSFNYPHNVLMEDTPILNCSGQYCYVLKNPVFPTPFYETTICFFLFLLLWSLRKKIKAPGALFCVYLMLNGIERFFIELIRINTKYHFWGIEATQAQLISPIFFLLGLIGFFYFLNRAKHPAAISP